MSIEEGTFWDEHWVLYGNQFDNKFQKKKKKAESPRKWWQRSAYIDSSGSRIQGFGALLLLVGEAVMRITRASCLQTHWEEGSQTLL